jgi:hypothetical protein
VQLLWIKRILFGLAVIVILSGHYLWNELTIYRGKTLAQKYAKVTAETWIAYAKFNNEPEKYRSYRDSLLEAQDISKEEIDDYIALYQKKPERYMYFATLVNAYVDSLVRIEDSTLKAVPKSAD